MFMRMLFLNVMALRLEKIKSDKSSDHATFNYVNTY